ncbi:hypothetical protein HYS54_01055 [Candidatus Micrarchaeota archaeon]|nr:hypothetical protein [Candidatus Micrarchaeota archaeon]
MMLMEGVDLAARVAQLERELSSAKAKLLELRDQRDLLEMEVDDLRFQLGKPQVSVEQLQDVEKYKRKMEEYFDRLTLLELVVKRYQTHVESGENKNISDLKTLIQPFHPRVQQIVSAVKASFDKFDEDAHLIKACEAAFDKSKEIRSIPGIGLQFWLSIDEMLDNKLADYDDKAMLVCSILRALGADASVVIVELSDASTRPLVSLKFGEKSVFIDPNSQHDFYAYFGDQSTALGRMDFDGRKVTKLLHQFNDREYVQHAAA